MTEPCLQGSTYSGSCAALTGKPDIVAEVLGQWTNQSTSLCGCCTTDIPPQLGSAAAGATVANGLALSGLDGASTWLGSHGLAGHPASQGERGIRGSCHALRMNALCVYCIDGLAGPKAGLPFLQARGQGIKGSCDAFSECTVCVLH